MRLLRLLIVLVILAVLGLAGYAYLGDMDAAPTEMRVPVQLDLGSAVPSAPAPAPASPTSAVSDDASAAPSEDESSID